MNETITRSAGASHGQELPPSQMETAITEFGRVPSQRSTLYGDVPLERRRASFDAGELCPLQFAGCDSYLIRSNAQGRRTLKRNA